MNQSGDEREWVQFQWPYVLKLLGGRRHVDRVAYETGAFVRARELRSPSDVLQLLLTWAVAERSLRETATLAAEAGMADVSDVALLKRFGRAESWLGALLGEYLVRRDEDVAVPLRIRLLDATAITRPGKRQHDFRLHVGFDLRTHRVDALELTDGSGSEGLGRFTFAAGEVVIADRAYAHRAGLSHVERSGAYYVVRSPWSSLPFEDEAGRPFDIIAALRSLPDAEASEFRVWYGTPDGDRRAARLVAIRKSEPAAERARQRAAYERRKSKSVDLRTLEAAGYLFVVTNLPPEISTESVLQLYRMRWQIEMKFKSLKSVVRIANLPARSETLARVYVFAKLLVALVVEDFVFTAESFSPWGYPLPAD